MAFEFIEQVLAKRSSEHLLRQRTVVKPIDGRAIEVDGKRYLNFSSNDYLGLASEPVANVHSSAAGNSSPLVTGYTQAHHDLEQRFCELLGYEAGMLFASGFSANQSVLKALFSEAQSGVLIQDKLNHASLIDGGLQAKAAMQRFNHNNLGHLQSRLEKAKGANKLVVTESVFSMDGDTAPLADIKELCTEHDAWLMVDDAHGFGVLNQGLGSATHKPEVLVITFGKAMACNGAIVLANKEVISLFAQCNRDYIYSTSLSPLQCQVIDARLSQVLNADGRRAHLNELIGYFKEQAHSAGIATMESDTPIQPIIVGDSESALAMQAQAKELGVWLSAIRPPTVAQNTARLRITLTASHSKADVNTLIEVLRACR